MRGREGEQVGGGFYFIVFCQSDDKRCLISHTTSDTLLFYLFILSGDDFIFKILFYFDLNINYKQ